MRETRQRTYQARIIRNCRACHGLKVTVGEGSKRLKHAASAKREELGIGHGYFIVGYDLRIRHADPRRSQAVADALRCAMLVADGQSR